MASYKKVLELHCSGLNNSQIGERVGCDRATVRRVIAKSEMKGILPDQWRGLDEAKIRELLRKDAKVREEYLQIDFDWMHRELSNKHVTVNLLHEEYVGSAEKSGLEAYSRSQFFNRYRAWCNTNQYSAKIKSKPGHSVELDFAGDLVHYIDPLTRQPVKVTLFVAVLSFSNLVFVQAVDRQTAVRLAHATIDAFAFFGGTTRAIIVDNTKAAVILHSKHEQAVLNELFRELAEHYGATVIAAPPRVPKAKPNVEGGVYNAYTRIIAPLRHCTFYSLDELNEALASQCEAFNREPFKERPSWSRHSLFLAEEQQMLSQLPSIKFEVREKATATVRENCHAKCSLDGYYYSVPYVWCKKQVVLRLGSVDVRIFSQYGQFICSHPRGTDPWHHYVTDPTHMPSYIREYVYASPGLFRGKAADIGRATHTVIDRLFTIAEANGRVPEVEYESARGILGLGRPTRKHPKRSAPVLEAACDRLVGLNPLPFSRIGYRAVSDVVQAIIEERSQKESNDFISKGGGKGSLLDILEDE
jgi:transposase